MTKGRPLPGRVKPTARSVRRAQLGARQDIRLPDKEFQSVEDEAGQVICPVCHAISVQKRWFFDDRLYEELRQREDVKQALCPGDARLAEERYEGEVILTSPTLADPDRRAEALRLIRNEAMTARENNPLHRARVFKEGPEELYLVTATAHLAERIGRAFRNLWHADGINPQGSVRVRLLKRATRRSAARRNQMVWPSNGD